MPELKWTEEHASRYVERPHECPICGSRDIEFQDATESYQERDGHRYYHDEAICLKCPAQWENVYRLVGVAPLEDQYLDEDLDADEDQDIE